jgi:bifunctional enzyme CysN/CysC
MASNSASGPDRDETGAPGLLRFLTCGSVDDGKSTLIGRLLYDAQLIYDDQLKVLERESRRYGTTGDEVDLSLLMHGLEAEREQSITIDVAYRYFSTSRRAFIVADTPGHEQFTRNMATGASNSELAVLLVDASKGLLPQTRRHALICSFFGIRHFVLAVNKMDLIGYAQRPFEQILAGFLEFTAGLPMASALAIPVSGRFGDNVVTRSGRTPWYPGPTLLDHLETIEVGTDVGARPFRFPVQWINRPDPAFRGYSGTVASGSIRRGDPVVVATSGAASRIDSIVTADGPRDEAGAGEAVTLTLTDAIDVTRGDLLVRPSEPPEVADQFGAHVLWMAADPLLPGRSYLMRIGHSWIPVTVSSLKHKLDIQHLEPLASRTLALNEIGFCNLSCLVPVAFDHFDQNPATGAFILVDRYDNSTVGAGMIAFALRRAANIGWERLAVDKTQRGRIKHQQPCIVWFTGLPGSGKSTIARLLEARLHAGGHHSYMLDGDNLRHGLNRDLGFTDADRVENVRRAGEVARLFVDAGLIVLCAFVSPFAPERAMVRDLVQPGEFIEVFVDTPLEECMRRDPKGLYAKARAGAVQNLTGIGSRYEPPPNPELVLRTMETSPDTLADRVLAYLTAAGRLA